MFAARCLQIFSAHAITTAADAWSYGVLVYTLLVGFPPFFPHAGGRSAEMKEQVRTGARTRLPCGRTRAHVESSRSSAARSGSRRRSGPAYRLRCARARACGDVLLR